MPESADLIVIGAGLSGLVAACEAAARGKKVLILDQEGEQNLGGQAFWSLGGLFMVDTPEQRRMGIKDSPELAYCDWMGSAGFDRKEDYWPQETAKAYLEFAHGEMRSWLYQIGMRWFPVVGWAERGGSSANGHGNSVPRFHLTWGTGPGVLKPFVDRALAFANTGKIIFKFRHRVTALDKAGKAVSGVSGEILEPTSVKRGEASSRKIISDFSYSAQSVLVSSGGIGGNFDLVRKNWPVSRMGKPPKSLISGVPAHVDGLMIAIAKKAGGDVINEDRMWHYTEGVKNWDPIWPCHGIRILPGPSSMWFDGAGNRFPSPCLPGFDTLETLKHIQSTGFDHSWFVLNQSIIEKEFALSGSEQNPDFTSGKWSGVLKSRLGKGAPAPVEAFKQHGEDFVVANSMDELIAGMKKLGSDKLEGDKIKASLEARDLQIANKFSKDAQITAINGARNYLGDKLIRTAKPHKILDPKHGPLIALKLHILTRKTLGGLHTNLQGNVLNNKGETIEGLYAAGECAGFGGGGYHGYNALEGSFLGGCIFSGRNAGRAAG